MLAQTTLEAHYRSRDETVLELFKQVDRPLSTASISEALLWPLNVVTWRVYNLKKQGKIKETGEYSRNKQGNKVKTYEVNKCQ